MDISTFMLYVIGAIFSLWIVLLGAWYRRLRSLRKQAERASEVAMLADFIQKKNSGQLDVENSPIPAANIEFTNYCRKYKINVNDAVHRHLQTIFICAVREGRLDLDALFGATNRYIGIYNSAIKSILSVFIIIGLFGTLLGLSRSLTDLSGVLDKVSRESIVASSAERAILLPDSGPSRNGRDDLISGLTRLLGSLSGAFYPSMAGVLLTILGVLLFSAFFSRSSQRTSAVIEYQTFTSWVPALFPSSAARLSETVELTRQHMIKNFEAAQTVVQAAEKINNDAGSLLQNIRDARGALSLLNKTSDKLMLFGDTFSNSVKTLEPFKEELRGLYRQHIDNSKIFQDTSAKMLDRSRDLHVTLENQFREFSKTSRGLLEAETGLNREFQGKMEGHFTAMIQESRGLLKAQIDVNHAFQQKVEDQFAKLIDESKNLFTAGFAESKTAFQEHADRAREFLFAINSYEKTFTKTQQDIHASLEATLKAAESAFRELEGQNRAVIDSIVKEVGDPLKKDLSEKLNEMTGRIAENTLQMVELPPALNHVAEEIKGLGNPVGQTAKSIHDTVVNFNNITRDYMKDVKHEFYEQNSKYRAELGALGDLNSNLERMSTALETNAHVLTETRGAYVLPSQPDQNMRPPRVVRNDGPGHEDLRRINPDGFFRRNLKSGAARIGRVFKRKKK